VLGHHGFALLQVQAGEREHTNLVGDVGPGALGSYGFEFLSQKGSHFNDSSRHFDKLTKPLLSHGGVVEDHGGDSGSVLGRGRVVSSDDNFDLGKNLIGGGFLSADEVKGSDSLSVESHDLGEGLGDAHLESLVKEESEGLSVLVEVSSDESLVGDVEEGVKTLFLDDLGDGSPLVHGWVDSGGVVGAGVEEDDGSGGGFLEVGDHTVEVKSLGLLVKVPVLSHVHATSVEDRVVVSPGRVADVDGGSSVLNEEIGHDFQGSGSGKSLGSGDSSAGDVLVVPAEEDTSSALVELLKAVNREVLLVEAMIVDDLLLSGSDDVEHDGLTVFVSVGSDSEVDLSGVFVSFVSSGEGEDGVSRGLLDVSELGVAESGVLSVELGVKLVDSFHGWF